MEEPPYRITHREARFDEKTGLIKVTATDADGGEHRYVLNLDEYQAIKMGEPVRVQSDTGLLFVFNRPEDADAD